MKKINNLEDLRYRKLFLRSKIELKEQKISSRLYELKDELNTADFKNEILRSAMSNPSMVINIARLSYDLITRIRKFKQKKRARRKAKKS
jgi:ribosome-associated translation inhibitor RaiA